MPRGVSRLFGAAASGPTPTSSTAILHPAVRGVPRANAASLPAPWVRRRKAAISGWRGVPDRSVGGPVYVGGRRPRLSCLTRQHSQYPSHLSTTTSTLTEAHNTVQRTYALQRRNRARHLRYGRPRRRVSSYYAEAWTGLGIWRLAHDLCRHDARGGVRAQCRARHDGGTQSWNGPSAAIITLAPCRVGGPCWFVASTIRAAIAGSLLRRRRAPLFWSTATAWGLSCGVRRALRRSGTLECRTLIVNGSPHTNATLKEGEDLRV
jgi:hypothetical protein